MHDKNGKPLKLGDKVSVDFVIDDVQPGVEYCNCRVKIPGENGPANVLGQLTLNSRQVTKLEDS